MADEPEAQLIEAWRTNQRMLVGLIDAIDAEGMQATLSKRRRTRWSNCSSGRCAAKRNAAAFERVFSPRWRTSSRTRATIAGGSC